MVRQRGIEGPPRSYVSAGDWPEGTVEGPVAARVAAAFAVRLHQVVDGRGLREVARAAEMDHSSLRAILEGEAWPTLVVIAKLEAALDVDLWPGRVAED